MKCTWSHLHFEVIKNGQKVDPLKIKAATGENLSGAKLTAFKKVVAEIQNAEQKTTETVAVSETQNKTESSL